MSGALGTKGLELGLLATLHRQLRVVALLGQEELILQARLQNGARVKSQGGHGPNPNLNTLTLTLLGTRVKVVPRPQALSATSCLIFPS